jgi:type I restriction enzyme S subunit
VNPLPRTWTSVELGETGIWRGGGTPSKDVPEFWANGKVPWVSPKDMKVDVIRDSEDHITDRAVDHSAANRVAKGSVLIVTRSGILAHTLPVAVNDVEVTINQDLKALTPHNGIEADFVARALRAFGSDILKGCKKDGTTVASIDFEGLQRYQIPLAPQNEQRCIVEAIDSYLTRLDAAVASLERVHAKLKAYRAAVLKAAVEGRLVPTEASLARAEKREYERRRRWEEAELARLKAAGKAPKDDKWKAKYEEPAAPDRSTLPDLPQGWCWATLPQLGELNRGKSKHRPRNDPRLLGGNYPFVQTGDIRKADTWLRTFDDTYSDFGLAQSRLWPAGTLCITIAANIAKTAILEFDACFPDSVVGFLQGEPILTRYVEMFLRTAQQRLDQYAPATAQKNINLDTLVKVAVPLPPLNEQRRMVDELDRLFSVGRTVGDCLLVDKRRCARLRQAVLKWAFEGKLVEQEPTDEPADRLLARLRAEHGPAAPAVKNRRRTAKGAA